MIIKIVLRSIVATLQVANCGFFFATVRHVINQTKCSYKKYVSSGVLPLGTLDSNNKRGQF